MKYLIANWKQNKKIDEIKPWFEVFKNNVDLNLWDNEKLKVIIAPPFPFLFPIDKEIRETGLESFCELSSQDISPYLDGPHTGEVGLNQIPQDTKYCLIGHSERRKGGEDVEKVNSKLGALQESSITPIICFSNLTEFQSARNDIGDNIESKNYLSVSKEILFAYEPIEAIGSGNPASVESLREIKSKTDLDKFVYGGSVDPSTINNYLQETYISGFLVGGASLDPIKFSELTNILLRHINN